MAILHWKLQRITAIILVPAIIYLIIYFLNIHSLSYIQIKNDITSTFGMIFISFTSIILFSHSSLGIETILEDYIHEDKLQKLLINLSNIMHGLMLLLTLIFLLVIARN
ncbi:MAG: succinate dehydrogenase, hydrophobic membrane anchor protein [Gammaproteobacteria bacterium]|nr:succinate dehydrogenase, hydrophobic membrane anchor protein [Gammaproteobacteria bacterium]